MNTRCCVATIWPLLLVIKTLVASSPEPIVLREVLAIEQLGVRGRSAITTDPLEFALAMGTWRPPRAGDTMTTTAGEQRTWEVHVAAENGQFTGAAFRGGWAFATVDLPAEGPWRLRARGHRSVYVDGVPRGGDVYRNGVLRIPLELSAGPHTLLFRCGRGSLNATLEPAPAAIYFDDVDRTVPDFIRGEPDPVWIAVIVANATDHEVRGAFLVARTGDQEARSPLPVLAPASCRKVPFQLAVPSDYAEKREQTTVHLELFAADETQLHATHFDVRIRQPSQQHSRTFLSDIDGSVQYYAVTPPAALDRERLPDLVLTLHGAAVEARNQAWSYQPKENLWIVAPTNRRPFGFDWEDWGRTDVMEVLAIATRTFGTNPRRTYLTGHSMGGHGTWQVGAHFPNRFAAIAPSAGWREFWSYGGGGSFPPSPVGEPFARAANASRTLLLEKNYRSQGIYILHGDKDDNVPVSEARAMRAQLGKFHTNFAYYERPGAGHWWGSQCVDWPPLFAFLRQNELPRAETLRRLEFTTISPAISSHYHWLSVQAAERWLEPCHVEVECHPEDRLFHVQLDNVAALTLDVAGAGLTRKAAVRVNIEEQLLEAAWPEVDDRLRLARNGDGAWQLIPRRARDLKGPHRAGPFKEAFGRRMVFVYGTQGTSEENAWSFAKARFDQETWQYRANGSVDVIRDSDFAPRAYLDRNVILYGNADSNAAWRQILNPSVLHVERGRLRCGPQEWKGNDLAMLAIYPRQDSDVASVGVIAGTGPPGMRTLNGLPYFVSGVGYPDWTVLRTRFLEEGHAGIEAAGFFGNDWQPEPLQDPP